MFSKINTAKISSDVAEHRSDENKQEKLKRTEVFEEIIVDEVRAICLSAPGHTNISFKRSGRSFDWEVSDEIERLEAKPNEQRHEEEISNVIEPEILIQNTDDAIDEKGSANADNRDFKALIVLVERYGKALRELIRVSKIVKIAIHVSLQEHPVNEREDDRVCGNVDEPVVFLARSFNDLCDSNEKEDHDREEIRPTSKNESRNSGNQKDARNDEPALKRSLVTLWWCIDFNVSDFLTHSLIPRSGGFCSDILSNSR